MSLLSRRRHVPAAQVDLARSRVSALSSRRGWVPRVPPAAMRALSAPGLAETAVADGEAVEAAVDAEAVATRRPGRHAKPADPVVDPSRSGDSPETTGWGAVVDESDFADVTSGSAGSAITDRLPLPVRAVVEGLPPSVRKGRAGLKPAHAVAVVLVLLLGLAATALLTGLGRPRVQAIGPGPVSTVLATGTPAVAPDAAVAAEADSELVIHVAGKVASPGIVRLPSGSRVIDAIEAAGGAEMGVDLTPLNLARVLGDGEQVVVGVDPPPQSAADQGSAGPSAVSLNSASAEQLATLPGIGPTLAARIVQWREQNGRFTAVDELLEVSGIGPAKFEAIADLVAL